jgi:hypothetical protein
MARSCFSAAWRVLKVPKFLRLPVLASGLLEYRRYSPDFSFLIMTSEMQILDRRMRVIAAGRLEGDHESATTDGKERDVATCRAF